ncbi:MAG: hypothetical protein OHK0013_43910 [Sandaracinaceae bacterium]
MSQGPEHPESAVVGWVVKRAIHALALSLALGAMPLARAQSDAGLDAPTARDPFRELVDSDPFAGDDPVGADAEVGATTDPIAAESTADLRAAPLPSEDELVGERLPVVRGEIVEAVAGVREVGHEVTIELVAGLALVRTEVRLESRARYAAEIGYRLAVPEDAVPHALEVCDGAGRCRGGRLEASAERVSAYDAAVLATGPLADGALPVAVVERTNDARGAALRWRAAPIPAATRSSEDGSTVVGVLVVRIAYSVPVPVHGGVARLVVPARGVDSRAANTTLSLRATDLVAPRVDGVEIEADERLERAPGTVISIDARTPRTGVRRAELWTVPCGRDRCAWARGIAERPSVAVEDVVLAIDASPSTSAGARGLVPEAALAVLAQLPPRARVRVVAFAARAEVLVAEPVPASSVDDALLRRAAQADLGAATRFEALWRAIAPWATRGLRVVWIGDGGLTSGEESACAVDEARRRGIVLRVISVADRPPVPALRALAEALEAPIVGAHREAIAAARARSREALVERTTFAVASDPLDELVWSVPGAAPRRALLLPGGAVGLAVRGNARSTLTLGGARAETRAAEGELARAIEARSMEVGAGEQLRLVAAEASPTDLRCGEPSRVLHPSATLARVTPLPNRFARVERRTCRAPTPSSASGAERRSGLSAGALLRTLRRRIMPRARDCFRSDRRGRASYSTEVALVLTLADQEIVDVRAEGAIEPALRACMVAAADALEVPAFDGVIVARWPLYSRPELPPPTLELHPDLASAIDRIGPSAETGPSP